MRRTDRKRGGSNDQRVRHHEAVVGTAFLEPPEISGGRSRGSSCMNAPGPRFSCFVVDRTIRFADDGYHSIDGVAKE